MGFLVAKLYKSLARVGSIVQHIRQALAGHQHRFSRRKVLELLRILENGGIVNGKVSSSSSRSPIIHN
jgi:hypothetical protein